MAKHKKDKKYLTGVPPFSRNIVLDTNVFKKNNFDFDAYAFQQLKQRHKEDRASVYITEIVEHEVRARMRRELEEAKKLFNPFRKEARILFCAPGGALYKQGSKLDTDELFKNMGKAFDVLLGQLDAETIECSNVPIEPILTAFFEINPPFGTKEDKRREFPDAISVAAIAEHFKGDAAWVISEDKLLQDSCLAHKHLKVSPTLEAFLAAELADHENVSWIVAAVEEQSDELRDAIKQGFQEQFFYLDDQEGDVEEVEVTDVEIETPDLVETTEYQGVLSIECTISYTARISYDDPDATVYSEGERYSFGTINDEVERATSETATVHFDLDRKGKEVSGFSCPMNGSIGIAAIEYYD